VSAAGSVLADLALIDRIERHAAAAWPARHTEQHGDGWLLRATPGLDRARSNHALTPRRALRPGELDAALAAAAEFSRRHGTPLGMQITPLDLHPEVLSTVAAAGWTVGAPIDVMGVDVSDVDVSDALELQVTTTADAGWISTWARCNAYGPQVTAAHRENVLSSLASRALFMRAGESAAGFAVVGDGLAGLFSLAVRDDMRRQGLGRRLVAGMLARAGAPQAYLQVNTENEPGLALYRRLGFRRLYRYQHARATDDRRR
jgi:ribosomal protein S18 acetylase RimI-like enzyme